MDEQLLQRRHPDPLQGLPALLATLKRRVVQLSRRLEVMRQHLALVSLDPRLLSDIGVCAETTGREAAKPAWRPWTWLAAVNPRAWRSGRRC